MHSKKSGLLLTLLVLEKETDIQHHLTQKEIIQYMKQYSNNPDLNFDRKTIAEYIEILRDDFHFDIEYDFDSDYKFNRLSKKKGYALVGRDFDESEVQVLMDSLFSSKFLSAKSIKQYRESLYKHLSRYSENKVYKFIEKTDLLSHNGNQDIFLNAEDIVNAIRNHSMIEFKYKRFDEKGEFFLSRETFIVTPFYLINNFGNYYMICSDEKHKDIALYKVNYISDIKVLGKSRLKKEDVIGMGKDFDITKFLNENVYLYGTNKKPVDAEILILKNKNEMNKFSSSVGIVKEWFGDKVVFEKRGDDTIFKVRCSPQGLLFWLLQFGNIFEVLKPKSLRDELRENLEFILKRYKK